jgi:hypothetical protein
MALGRSRRPSSAQTFSIFRVLNNPVSSGNPAQQAAAIRPNWEERPGGAAKAVRRVRIVFDRCVLDAFGDFTAASLNGNDRVGLAMNDRGPDIELFLRVLVKSVSETPTAVFAHRRVDLKRLETQDGCASEAIMLLGISYVEFGYR